MLAVLSLALLGCQEVGLNDTSAPEITLLQPIDGGRFDPTQPVEVCASVDYAGTVESLDVVLSSDLDGTLATEGFTECPGGNLGISVMLSGMSHVLSMTVTDIQSRSDTAIATVTPLGNVDPTCSFISPAPDAQYLQGELFDATVRVEDVDGGDLSVALSSDLDGPLSTLPTVGDSNVAFASLAVSPGSHVLLATVTDSLGGSGVCTLPISVVACVDEDGDGFSTCDDDCDDSAPHSNPSQPELPDGQDNDCDGIVDEGTALFDDDGDGFNELQGDCDDTDPTRNPDATDVPDDGIDQDCSGTDTVTCFDDGDGDGYGNTTTVLSEGGDCFDPGVAPTNDDCDDTLDTIHPGAAEIPADGIDQDCDGVDPAGCYQDLDGDGYGTSVVLPPGDADCTDVGESAFATDCDDTDAGINPDADEVFGDGIDQDCTGDDAVECFVDADFDGFGSSVGVIANDGSCDTSDNESANEDDCDDTTNAIYPGATEIAGDGIDQDCSGGDALNCFVDEDGDGYGTSATLPSADNDCNDLNEADVPGDCDDEENTINPDGTEIPGDGIDQDCNFVDAVNCYEDLDMDGYGSSIQVVATDGSCTQNQQESPIDGDCDDTAPNAVPGGTEEPDDGIDQDCSGADTVSCFEDDDNDGYGTSVVVFAEDGTCDEDDDEAEVDGDCDDADSAIYPGATDTPGDGIDSDCNGVDGADADGDGYSSDVDCDDSDADINPGASEVRDNADNNCDGMCDEGLINVGDLIVTEVMSNPDEPSATRGEWFELYNTTGMDITLCGGWFFKDHGIDSHEVDTDFTVPANGYALVASSGSTGANGGLPAVDYVYVRSELPLGNNASSPDELFIEFNGVVIDEPHYFTIAAVGKSQQLDPGSFTETANNTSTNWCDSTSAWPGSDGDFGTPGAPNISCP